MNSALKVENKTAERKEEKRKAVQSFPEACFVSSGQLKLNVLRSLFREFILFLIQTTTNTSGRASSLFFDRELRPERGLRGPRTVSSSADRVPQTVKPPQHQIRRCVVCSPMTSLMDK